MSSYKPRLFYIIGVFIFYLWYQAVVNVLYAGTLFAYSDFTDFVVGFAINCSIIFLLFLINTEIVYKLRWKCNMPLKVLLDFILSLGAPIVVNGIFYLIAFIAGKTPEVLWLQAYVVNVMIFMINETSYFLIHLRHSEQKYETSRRIAIQLEYDVLRAQVNPHFLFNSLNILYSLTHIDIDKSREFIISLSGMYRYIMAHRGETSVPLREELDFFGHYADVLKTIYFDSLEIHISGENNINNSRIVPYSMQLLLENVIKHNVISSEFPMKVDVVIDNESIKVTNILRPKEESLKNDNSYSTGTGLKYLKELHSRNGRGCVVTVTDNTFEVEVPLLINGGEDIDKTSPIEYY